MPRTKAPPRHCQLMAPAEDPQEYIESSIYWYPLIFPDRTAVLDHTFLVNGNGYEWGEDGNLWSVFAHIEPDYDREYSCLSSALKLEAEAAGLADDDTMRSLLLDWAARDRAEDERLASIRAGYKRLARTYGPVRDREQAFNRDGTIAGYQARTIGAEELSRWTLLGRVPANVTPAWQAVVDEVRHLFAPLFTQQEKLF